MIGFTAAAYASDRREVTVRRTVDGDTFETTNREKIRFIGINCPEYQPQNNKVDPYGKEAADFLKKILTRKKVFLESDVEPRDKYTRTLAYVYDENGRFINQLLVEEGYARAKAYPPNLKHQNLFKEAEATAQEQQKGLWDRRKNSAMRSWLDKFLPRA